MQLKGSFMVVIGKHYFPWGVNTMKIGLTQKLFLSILMASSLAVVSSVFIIHWSFSYGVQKYATYIEKSGLSRLAVKLEKHYGVEGNWDFLRGDPLQWRHLVAAVFPMEMQPPMERMPPPESMEQPSPPRDAYDNMPRRDRPPEFIDAAKPPPPGLPPPHLARHMDERLYLLDVNRSIVISRFQVPLNCETLTLRHQGRIIGYLGILPWTRRVDIPLNRFLQEQQIGLALTGGVIVLLSTVLSLLLAKRLVRPIRDLAMATHQMTAGSFSVRVPVTSNDELGQLAHDFNSLAIALERNEQTRRQWVADISHELRTPLAILRGEIEAIQDGIRQPDQKAIQSLHAEILRLGRLVDDLYQLSLSDVGALSYRESELVLADVLTETLTVFRPEFEGKGVSLEVAMGKEEPSPIFGDPERLRQLFTNLLDNSLKYTDHGGKLLVRLDSGKGVIAIDFQDSAPGVPSAALERLFDRLYRVDSSRNRSTGGAGLGLAICRSIVEAHGGSIKAKPSPLGGLWVRVEFPVKGNG